MSAKQMFTVFGLALVGTYTLWMARAIDDLYYQRTRRFTGLMRRLFPVRFYHNPASVWMIRLGGILMLAVSLGLLILFLAAPE